MSDQNFYIEKCRKLIEEKLSWGSSDDWQSQDFDNLGEQIFEATNISISSSTLKRIWGKVKYDSSPNLTTLNALAQFTGYPSWRAFTSNGLKSQTETEATPEIVTTTPKRSFSYLYRLVAGILFFGCLIGFWAFRKKFKTVSYQHLSFTSKPVTAGIPNTVIFEYNAAGSNADSVCIQQSWDRRLRMKVDKDLHQFTTTYYRPGYYKAKLLLNDSVVKEHDLFIESGGWLGMIEKTAIPVYFTKQQIIKEGTIGITEEELKAAGADMVGDIPWVSFYNIEKDKVVPGGRFRLETTLKNTFKNGDAVCQKTQVILLGKNGMISIPLGIKGCAGEFNMAIGNKMVQGKTNDLSGLGVDFNEFVKLTCTVSNQQINIRVNDKPVYQSAFTQDIGDIVGTVIQFNGAGLIRNCVLEKIP